MLESEEDTEPEREEKIKQTSKSTRIMWERERKVDNSVVVQHWILSPNAYVEFRSRSISHTTDDIVSTLHILIHYIQIRTRKSFLIRLFHTVDNFILKIYTFQLYKIYICMSVWVLSTLKRFSDFHLWLSILL